MFYSTKTKDGKFVFQGVSKLVTHKNRDEETTQGTGFLGLLRNMPVEKQNDIPKIFRRN